MRKNAFAAGTLSRTPPGELNTAIPRHELDLGEWKGVGSEKG